MPGSQACDSKSIKMPEFQQNTCHAHLNTGSENQGTPALMDMSVRQMGHLHKSENASKLQITGFLKQHQILGAELFPLLELLIYIFGLVLVRSVCPRSGWYIGS